MEMLGELVGEEKGKVTARRVLEPQDGRPRVEISFEGAGSTLGVETTGIGTYWSTVRPDGVQYGEGNGVVMGKGGELATWKGQGVGKFRDDGGISYRGALYYETQSSKLARLNGIALAFEYDVDAEGNTTSKIWEWK